MIKVFIIISISNVKLFVFSIWSMVIFCFCCCIEVNNMVDNLNNEESIIKLLMVIRMFFIFVIICYSWVNVILGNMVMSLLFL